MLGGGGCEILIKVDLQSIPTYIMSLFKLPISLCDELKSLFLNFLWGTKESQLSPLKIELNTLHFVLYVHDLINKQNSGHRHSLIGRTTLKNYVSSFIAFTCSSH